MNACASTLPAWWHGPAVSFAALVCSARRAWFVQAVSFNECFSIHIALLASWLRRIVVARVWQECHQADQLEAITAARLEPFHQCLALFLRGLFANGGSEFQTQQKIPIPLRTKITVALTGNFFS